MAEELSEFKMFQRLVREKQIKPSLVFQKRLVDKKWNTKDELMNLVFEHVKLILSKKPNITKTELNSEISRFTGYSQSVCIQFLNFLIYKNKIKIFLTGKKNYRRIEIVEPSSIEEPLPNSI